MSVDYVKLGIRVRIRRENLRMSQAEVASAAGISIQHVSNIENAKTKFTDCRYSKCFRLFGR